MGGKISKGMSAGGKAYGYRPVKKFDDHGELIRGELEIVPQEAAIVQRIFEAPKEISQQLTREGVAAPRGADCSPSAIYDWAERGSGILRNSICVGRLVWNKNQMVKNPDTGKRVSRPRIGSMPNCQTCALSPMNCLRPYKRSLPSGHRRRRKIASARTIAPNTFCLVFSSVPRAALGCPVRGRTSPAGSASVT